MGRVLPGSNTGLCEINGMTKGLVHDKRQGIAVNLVAGADLNSAKLKSNFTDCINMIDTKFRNAVCYNGVSGYKISNHSDEAE